MANCSGSTWVVADSRVGATISMDVNVQSQDITNNRSTVSYTARVVRSGTNITFTGSTRNNAGIARANLTTGASIFSGAAVPLTNGSALGQTVWSKSGTFTVNHDSSGKASIGFNFTVNRGGGNYSGDTCIWENNVTNNGSLTLPTIDRTGGSCTVSTSSVSPTSAVLKVTSTVACTKIRYSKNNGSSWTTINLTIAANSSNTFTISGLSENTSYTVLVQVQRSYNNVWSSSGSVTFKTSTSYVAPDPSGVVLTPVLVTPNIIQVRVTNDAADGITYFLAQYGVRSSTDGSVVTMGSTGQYLNADAPTKGALISVTGLAANTTYAISALVFNNYGKHSDEITIYVTTKRDQASIFVKDGNTWKLAWLFYKQSGTWKPVYALWYKQNGSWKALPRFWDK